MKEYQGSNHIFSGYSIAKNTIYNLVGYSIPILFAIVVIPFLIKGLGVERFGVLNLAWVVIGYFSFFDFGISRALTKIVAEKIGTKKTEEIPSFFWTSFFLMLIISSIFTVVLLFFIPTLITSIIKISTDLQKESLTTFYLLTFSIPIVTTTAGIRGVLEAYQKFFVINIIRTFLGVSTFLVPLVCLIFTDSLVWIVLSLLGVRIIVWLLYMSQCLKLSKELKKRIKLIPKLIYPIFKLGGWMTLSNIIVPLLVYLDRFLIGALVSATAIAYYSTPYEVVTKLLIIPGAMSGVLFPAFSASHLNDPEFVKKLSFKAVKYIFIILFPIIFVLITFSNEGLGIWLGEEFASKSSLILQLLAVGVLFNSFGYIPFAFLDGIGRPDITAKVQLVELPIYITTMWLAITYKGINGAAFVWMLRTIVDASILFFFAKAQIKSKIKINFDSRSLLIFMLIVLSVIPVLINFLTLKILSFIIILTMFIIIVWKLLLIAEEKAFLKTRLLSKFTHY